MKWWIKYGIKLIFEQDGAAVHRTRANITLYNSRMNIDSNLINIKSPSYYFNNDNQNVIPSSDAHIQPVLQNIVSTANFGCELCLREIALRAKNAEYNPKRFAAVIMRIKEPKTTALIFSSGKMVCTGAKNEDDSKKASRKYAKIIRSLGFPVEFKEFKVQNIVGSCDIKFQIHLNKLNGILGKLQSKDKEQRRSNQNGYRRANDQDRKLPGQIPGSGLCVISHKRKHSNKSCRIKNCSKDHPLGKRYIDDVHGQDTKTEPGRKEIRHNHQDKVDQQAEPD